jgi:hypothetical protein
MRVPFPDPSATSLDLGDAPEGLTNHSEPFELFLLITDATNVFTKAFYHVFFLVQSSTNVSYKIGPKWPKNSSVVV